VSGLVLAWLLGEGIIVWRAAKQHELPVPGNMLAASALFAMLALLAEYEPARKAAVAFAFGVDIAVLMLVLPGGTTPAAGKTATKKKAATPVTAG
jgi:hypothetical protein